MPDDLYDRDILEWSLRQAERLRRVARGERVNDVDWAHVVEEIEDVGKSELSSVQSLLFQAILHVLKAQGWPGSDAAAHWRLEAGAFLSGARRRYSAAMRQHIDLSGLYGDALGLIRQASIDGQPPAPLPEACPFALDELLASRIDLAVLQSSLVVPDADARAE